MSRTLIAVDRTSAQPLYRQVREAIEHEIAVGLLDPDRPLPSSRQLAAELGLSRNTINLAYQELLAEGFIDSRPRRGLFVNREMRVHPAPPDPRTATRFEWSHLLGETPPDDLPHVIKHAGWHAYPYPFVAGQFDRDVFPRSAWLRCLRQALDAEHVHSSLQDSMAADDPLLIEMIRRHVLPSRGIEAAPDEMVVTMGSQHGLFLVASAITRPGSVVAVENPGYLDARHLFVRAGARLLPVPVDAAGLVPPEDLTGVAVVHVTPSHQHPTNVTLSIGRRRRLLALAQASGAVIVEDDYDSEFRYQGSPTPALKALDTEGRVVYIGTFSKFLAPGLRLGYVVGDAELIDRLRDLRRYMLRHPPGQLQRALALLIRSGEYDRVVRRYRARLKQKWEAMTTGVNDLLPWVTAAPPGGVSLWMSGPAELDGWLLAERAERAGVLIEPGDVYFLDPAPPRNHFRLGFAAIPLPAIRPGLERLARALEGAVTSSAQPRTPTSHSPQDHL